MTVMRKVILVARNSPVAVATAGELEKFEIWNPDIGKQLTEFAGVTEHAYNGRSLTYDLQTQDQPLAEGLAPWLRLLIGKTHDKFGEFRLDV
jgi:hypothetical protein